MKRMLVPALAFALGAAFMHFAAPRPVAGAPSGPKAVSAALAERMPDTAEEMALFCRSRYADVAEEAVDELLNALDGAGPADAVRLLRTLMDASETCSSAERAVDAMPYLDPRPAAACMSAILGSGGVYAETLARRFEDITGRAEATEEAVAEWLEEELSDD